MTNIVNENRPIPRHINIKFENTENKEHTLKASREGKEHFPAKISELEWLWTSQRQHWKRKERIEKCFRF